MSSVVNCRFVSSKGKHCQPSPSVLAGLSDHSEYVCFPGFCDVHVHFREPGFLYKETIASGSRAAARGGYTTVCPMPNLSPVPDSRQTLEQELAAIRRDALIRVIPYGSITKGELGKELSEMEAMKEDVAGFSDDGKGVQDPQVMREAMLRARALGRLIVAHCEDNSLLPAPESEWKQIERDIELAEETGCAYHVCHISCKESVELIRQAKKDRIDVSCETAPHYLLLNDSQVEDHGRFKMNPPIRKRKDQEALIEGLADGTIEMIATDHAPHSAEEKARGFAGSLSGIVGIETAFPLIYTGLVKTGLVSMETVVNALAVNPYRRFGLERREDDYSIWDLNDSYVIDPADFLSMGKSTPFEGWTVSGRCVRTVCGGQLVYRT